MPFQRRLFPVAIMLLIPTLAPAEGHLWSRRFGAIGAQYGSGVTVDQSGSIVIAGAFTGAVDFGGGILTSQGDFDIFVAKFTPSGSHLWSRRYGDMHLQCVNGVKVDDSGNVFIAGDFWGSVDFGGGVLTSAGSSNVFVAKFNALGAHIWSHSYGAESVQSMAVDKAGNVIIAGLFTTTVDFGGVPLTSMGGWDIFVAKLGFGTVPALLQKFTAEYGRSGTEISWTLSELPRGIDFHVLRRKTAEPQYQELPVPRIDGNGASFTFVDGEYERGVTYLYRVDASDSKDRWTLFETQPIATPAASLALFQNYPNPFDPMTTIAFSIPHPGAVKLAVSDALGRLVEFLVDGTKNRGRHIATWDGRDSGGKPVASGVYFVRLEADRLVATRKIALLR